MPAGVIGYPHTLLVHVGVVHTPPPLQSEGVVQPLELEVVLLALDEVLLALDEVLLALDAAVLELDAGLPELDEGPPLELDVVWPPPLVLELAPTVTVDWLLEPPAPGPRPA
jgi:hypothetical protein